MEDGGDGGVGDEGGDGFDVGCQGAVGGEFDTLGSDQVVCFVSERAGFVGCKLIDSLAAAEQFYGQRVTKIS